MLTKRSETQANTNIEGTSALDIAIADNNQEKVSALIKAGAVITLENILAAINIPGSNVIFELLIQKQPYNLQNISITAHSNSLLHMLAQKVNSAETINTLVSLGLNPNSKNSLGQTPLHLAAITENNEVNVEVLVALGADIAIEDHAGLTPRKANMQSTCNRKALTRSLAHLTLAEPIFINDRRVSVMFLPDFLYDHIDSEVAPTVDRTTDKLYLVRLLFENEINPLEIKQGIIVCIENGRCFSFRPNVITGHAIYMFDSSWDNVIRLTGAYQNLLNNSGLVSNIDSHSNWLRKNAYDSYVNTYLVHRPALIRQKIISKYINDQNQENQLRVPLPVHDANEMMFLLQYASDVLVNAHCFDNGQTPLFVATKYINFKACELLLAYGANPLKKDNMNRVPISYAVEKHSKKPAAYDERIIELLTQHMIRYLLLKLNQHLLWNLSKNLPEQIKTHAKKHYQPLYFFLITSLLEYKVPYKYILQIIPTKYDEFYDKKIKSEICAYILMNVENEYERFKLCEQTLYNSEHPFNVILSMPRSTSSSKSDESKGSLKQILTEMENLLYAHPDFHKDLTLDTKIKYSKKVSTAARNNDTKTLLHLIRIGANINYGDPERSNCTPLMEAVMQDNKESVQILLQSGAHCSLPLIGTGCQLFSIFSEAISFMRRGELEKLMPYLEQPVNVNIVMTTKRFCEITGNTKMLALIYNEEVARGNNREALLANGLYRPIETTDLKHDGNNKIYDSILNLDL